MDKEKLTAFLSIVIGLFGGIATTVYPWPISDSLHHIIFWFSSFMVLAGIYLLVDAYYLTRLSKRTRFSIPSFIFIIFFALIFFVEPPKDDTTRTETGPVIVANQSDCPAGYMVIDESMFAYNGTAISAPENAKLCLVKNTMLHNGVGLQLRPDPSDAPQALP